jgi:hypothetical protein
VEFYNEKVKFKITDMYIYIYICTVYILQRPATKFKKSVHIFSFSKCIALLRNIDIGIVLYLFSSKLRSILWERGEGWLFTSDMLGPWV